MIATHELLHPRKHAGPTRSEIRTAIASIRRNWTPQERVLRQYVADIRRQSLLRAAASAA